MHSRQANDTVASDLNEAFLAKITIIYISFFRVTMNKYEPIFRGLDASDCRKLRTHTHTHTEDTKHFTQSRHQLKMASPANIVKKCSNFRIRQFKEKLHFNISKNLTLNTMVSFIILLIAHTARIACADRHTDTRDNYCNPRCACAPKVNNFVDKKYGNNQQKHL